MTKADMARLESRFDGMATKEDLNALRLELAELRGEMRSLGPELKADLSERIRSNTLATLAYMTALIGAAFAAVKFIH